MPFLAIFGKNVEDAFGPLLYLGFWFAGGFAAMMLQTAMTLLFGTAAETRALHCVARGILPSPRRRHRTRKRRCVSASYLVSSKLS